MKVLSGCCSSFSSANVWFTRRIAARSFQRVGARITQSSMNRAYGSTFAAIALVKKLQVERPHQGRERAAQRNPPLHILVEPPVIDRPPHVLPQQVEDTPVGHMALQHGEKDIVVDAGVIALHIGPKDERVVGIACAVDEPDCGLGPSPPFQVVALRVRGPQRGRLVISQGSGKIGGAVRKWFSRDLGLSSCRDVASPAGGYCYHVLNQ